MTATPTVDREALRRKSAPLLLCERARAQPDAIAFRCKHLGLYRERSWRDYALLLDKAGDRFGFDRIRESVLARRTDGETVGFGLAFLATGPATGAPGSVAPEGW